MRKLLALLTLLFTAICNNLEPVQVDDISFTDDSYYRGRTHTEVDYQGLYNDYIDESGQLADGCNISPRSAGSVAYKETSNAGRIWFVYENNDSLDKLVCTDKGETPLYAVDGQTIVAPSTCRIASSSNKSRGGTEMTITVGDYKITFYNMARWYCCESRSPSLEEDIHATFSHTKDAKGVTMSQGDILGYTTKDTTVLVQRLSSSGTYQTVSTEDFYN